MQVHVLAQTFAIDGNKTVIIDAGGAMIKWGVWNGIKVSGGATLCMVNATLNGQRKGRAVLGTGPSTAVRFIGVTFQNCKAKVSPPFSAHLGFERVFLWP